MNKKFTSNLYAKLSTKFLLGKESFILKSKRIHGNRYDYSKVEYNGNKVKVIIICPTHNKEFLITPNHHMRGKKCVDYPKIRGIVIHGTNVTTIDSQTPNAALIKIKSAIKNSAKEV